MSSVVNVLICECAQAGLIEPATLRRIIAWLKGLGVELHSVSDLCELAARRDPLLAGFAQTGSVKVLACHPRAVRSLFTAAGAPLLSGARLFNLRPEEAKTAITALQETFGPEPACVVNSPVPPGSSIEASSASDKPGTPGHSTAWFPVIDFDRCTHCLQCLSFCLFGVYGLDADQKLAVRAPENCKTNCPACARVCPELAIIFPKHKTAPITGDKVPDGAGREGFKVDSSSLLGGDIYSRLRNRSQPRFSKERDLAAALRQRQEFLARLVQNGDIPPEVFQNLEELRR